MSEQPEDLVRRAATTLSLIASSLDRPWSNIVFDLASIRGLLMEAMVAYHTREINSSQPPQPRTLEDI